MPIFETYSTEPTQFNFSLSSKTVVLECEHSKEFYENLTSIYAPGCKLSIAQN